MARDNQITTIRSQINKVLRRISISKNAALLLLLWDRVRELGIIETNETDVRKKLAYLMTKTEKLISITNREGYFEIVNDRWLDLLGYTFEEMTSSPYMVFIQEEDVSKSLDAAQKFNYLGGTPKDFENFTNRYIKKDGGTVEIIWNIYSNSHKDAEMGLSLAVAAPGRHFDKDGNEVKKGNE